MWRYSVLVVVLAVTAAACTRPTGGDTGDVSVTETTTIVFELDDQTYTVSRPVGCDAASEAPTDLDSEPAQWLAFGEYMRWFDAESCPVRVDVISHINGAEHCDVQDAEFITIGRPLGAAVKVLSPETANRYVWNADGVIGGLPSGETIAAADLPPTAADTGYVQGDKHLWLDEADESVLYVVANDTVQVFVRDFEAGLCA